jgi:DNA polymerase-1
MTKTLLIDTEVILYRIASALERPIHWYGDLWTLHCSLGEVTEAFDLQIAAISQALGTDNKYFALGDPTRNFRKEICLTYKANRKGVRKPVAFVAALQYVKDNYDTKMFPGLEADDVLGIMATDPSTGDCTVVSIDKDMNTLPVSVFNPMTLEGRKNTKEQAHYAHMLQTLTGDAADGYSGIPGVGPVSAAKILGDTPSSELWSVVVQAYQKKGLSEMFALQQARLAYILQHGDYCTTTNKINLWTP